MHRQAYRRTKSDLAFLNGVACRQTYCGDIYCSKKSILALKRTTIKDLRLEIMHKDKYLLVRVAEPCFKMSGIMALVEDPEGSVCLMSIYNYVMSESTDVEKLLPVGTIMAIKEPYYKFSNTDTCVVRCDSPSDMVLLARPGRNNGLGEQNLIFADMLLKDISWKGKLKMALPRQLAPLDPFKDPAVSPSAYWDFIEMCTNALRAPDIPDDVALRIRLYRALALDGVDHFEDALRDAMVLLDAEPTMAHGMKIAAKCLYDLRRYEQARSVATRFCMMYPNDVGISMTHKDCMLKQGAFRMLEIREGKYDLVTMMLMAESSAAPRLKHADYIGPVKFVRMEDGSVKVVLTEDVLPGVLLMATKAFQIVYASELSDAASGFMHVNFKTNVVSVPTRSQLTTKIARAILMNPSTAYQLYDLPTKDPKTCEDLRLYADEPQQLEPITDIALIQRIVARNSLHPELLDDNRLGATRDEKMDNDAGLWILPSHIAHSCDPSAATVFIGDFMFVRAKYVMKAGDEITLPYAESVHFLEDRRRALDARGIVCQCALCTLERAEPVHLAERRARLLEEFRTKFRLRETNDLEVVTHIIDGMTETYRKANRTTGIRQGLYLPYTALGAVYLARDERKRAAEAFEQALASLGFTKAHEEYVLNPDAPDAVFPRGLLIPVVPMTAVHIYHYYWNAGEKVLAEKWLRIAKGLNRILHGADEDVFRKLYHSFLAS